MNLWKSIQKSMSKYDLPNTLNVGGMDYQIRTDFRAILDILCSMNDPELDNTAKNIIMLKILFPNWHEIPQECLVEALEKGAEFIDCGNKDDGKHHPRLIDWEQDADLIVPAINSVAHTEIRALKELHWWTFMGYFMEIRESAFSSVLSIRQKKARGKKLEKWEKDFYQENRKIIDIKKRETEEDRLAKEYFDKWL